MKSFPLLLSICILTFGMRTTCRADMVLSIDSVTVFAGQLAVVGVYATSNSGDVLTGFNLPLDINNDGNQSLPTGFSYGSPIINNAIFANTGYDTPPTAAVAGVDAIPTGSGSNVVLSSVRTKLFDLRIQTAPNVAPGTVLPISIEIPPAPFSSIFNIAGFANGNLAAGKPLVLAPTLGTPVTGFVTVAAVPEPTTLAYLALTSAAATRLLKRKRRRQS